MFEILSQFVLDSLSKAIEYSLGLKTSSISRKRSLFSKLITLYDALEELENSSIAAYKELNSYASRKSVPTKTVANKYLSALANSYKNYVSALNEVESMLSIYDRPLMLILGQGSTGKSSLLKELSDRRHQSDSRTINLTSEVYPKQVRCDEKLTFNVSYPTSYPSTNIEFDQYRRLSKDELDKEAKKLFRELKKSLKSKQIDLRSPSKLEEALAHGESNILLMSRSRQQLANFIKENFPLEKLLEKL